MPGNLTLLVCGAPNANSELGQVLNHIRVTLETVVNELLTLKDLSDSRVSFYGPFLGRSILELSCTAVIARIDPFRVLVLREFQSRPDYQIGERSKISIQWQGDVLAEKKVQDLWSEGTVQKAMTARALFGDYYDHIFWRNAAEKMVDTIPDARGGPWMDELRKVEPNSFCSYIRGKIKNLYSSFSKGMHHEFVIPAESILDRATVSSLVREALYVTASIGLALTTIPHTPLAVSLDDAIESYEHIQSVEIV